MKMLFAIGVGINGFVIIQLIRKGQLRHLPTRIGLAISSVWTFRFLLMYLKFEPWTLNYPILLVIDQYLLFLDSVLLWMYARSVIQPLRFRFATFLHFIPFLLGLTLGVLSAVRYPKEIVAEYQRVIEALMNGQPLINPGVVVIIGIILFLSIFYFLRSVVEVKHYNHALKDNFSNIENLKVNWVLSFQRLWIALFVLPLLLYFINYINPIVDMRILGAVLVLSLLLLSVFFDSNLLSQSYAPTHTKSKQKTEESKDDITSHNQEQLQQLYAQLAEEKYYEDEQLSLTQLADHLRMKSVELTELIKKSPYDNFYDLVNSFRIEAVKKSLKNTSEQIIVIAYQCGFNSKSAFNKIFKEKTGTTPKAYRTSVK